jgi:hypothetical protein
LPGRSSRDSMVPVVEVVSVIGPPWNGASD